MHHPEIRKGVAGILLLPEKPPLLIVSRAILTSKAHGPKRGTLIMGRYLNSAEVGQLAGVIRMPLEMYLAKDLQMPSDYQTVEVPRLGNALIATRPLDESQIAGYALFNDVDGNPALIFKTVMKRDIYLQGKAGVSFSVWFLLGVGLIFAVITLFVLKRQILTRLSNLGKNISSIGMKKDISLRVPVSGQGELSELGGNINKMLGALEKSQSERIMAEDALRESEEKHRTLVNNLNVGVYRNIGGFEGRFLQANPTMVKMFGYDSVEEFLGIRVSDIYQNPQERILFIEEITKQGFVRDKHLRLKKKDGTPMWISVTATAHYSSDGQVDWVDGVMEDVTERKRIEDELILLSFTDQLTGLYNRRGFIEFTEQQLKVAQRAQRGQFLLFADLDNMKWINDTLGHQQGDEALIEVATVFKSAFRESDIIARIGGDEFAVLGIDVSATEQEAFVKRLDDCIAMYNAKAGRYYSISISIGMAYYDPLNPISLNGLMAVADNLMYEQKRLKKA